MAKKKGFGITRSQIFHHVREIGSGTKQSYRDTMRERREYKKVYEAEYRKLREKEMQEKARRDAQRYAKYRYGKTEARLRRVGAGAGRFSTALLGPPINPRKKKKRPPINTVLG